MFKYNIFFYDLRCILLSLSLIANFSLHCQYNINGNADSISQNCFRLTEALNGKWGSVWSTNKVNIKESFEVSMSLNFGNKDSGADGIAFVLQKNSNSAGSSGIGIGYAGISPSFAVEFDTYKNGFDPNEDHCAVQINGKVNHNISQYNVVPPIILSDGDIEDSLNYNVVISWNPTDTLFRVIFECDTIINLIYDIPNNVFSGDSMAYWGLTSATGARNNLHIFCYNYVSFFDKLLDTSMCFNDSLLLNGPDNLNLKWFPTEFFSDSINSSTFFIGDTSSTAYFIAEDTCGNTLSDTLNINVLKADLIPNLDTLDLCLGDTIYLNADTGTSFLWNTGNNTLSQFAADTGIYSISISLGNCQFKDSIYIRGLVPPEWVLSDTSVCNGTNVSLTLNNSLTADSIIWNDGVYQQDRLINVISDTLLISNYYAQGFNSNCLFIDTFNIKIKSTELILDSLISKCIKDSITLSIPNGTYSDYLWNNNSTNHSIEAIDSGSYNVLVSDSFNCKFSAIFILNNHPDLLNWLPEFSNISCYNYNDGEIILNLNNPSLVNINWSNSLNTENIVNLSKGTYNVTITDINNCSKDSSFNIEMPDSISIHKQILNPKCNGDSTGSISINTNGGTAPFSISWNNGLSDSSLTNLSAGTYIMNLTDSNGCSLFDTISLEGSDSIVIIDSISNIICFGDSNAFISLQVSGGTPPFSFLWNNGASQSINNNLTAGTYEVSVSDSLNCTKEASFSINNHPQILFSTNSTNICLNDSIDIVAIDSNNNITSWLWKIDGLQKSDTGITYIPGSYGLKSFVLYATDSNGCLDSLIETFEVYNIPQYELYGDSIICEGQSLTLSVTEGYMYQWNSSETIVDSSISEINLAPIQSNRYFITITDNNNCMDTSSIFVTLIDTAQIDLGPDISLISGESTTLQVSGGNSYTWSSIESLEQLNDSTIIAKPGKTATYYVVVEKNNCFSRDEILITVTDGNEIKIAVPKAFTPDGDGVNDEVFVYAQGVDYFEFLIFNRWGQLVFQTKDILQAWDGTYNNEELEMEIYTYLIKAKGPSNDDVIQKGQIQLIR